MYITVSRVNLYLVWSGGLGHKLDRFKSLGPTLTLQFFNPIGYGLHHFARGLSSRSWLWTCLLLWFRLTLLDNSNASFT